MTNNKYTTIISRSRNQAYTWTDTVDQPHTRFRYKGQEDSSRHSVIVMTQFIYLVNIISKGQRKIYRH